MSQQDPDPFTHLLTLEDHLYTSAYTQGSQDGARAGRIEGRVFGLEKGFEKFAELGALHGRAVLWGSRIRIPLQESSSVRVQAAKGSAKGDVGDVAGMDERRELDLERKDDTDESTSSGKKSLPPLISTKNTRLEKHIYLLHFLTDPLTFSTSNTEDGVADFDDRFKRAGAKAKMIERIVGENDTSSLARVVEVGEELETEITASGGKGVRTPKRIGAKIKSEGNAKGQKKGDDNFEDFTGSRLLR